MKESTIYKAATKVVSEAVIKNKLKEFEDKPKKETRDVEIQTIDRRIDNEDDDDMLAKWREKRANELKKMKDEMREFIENGHGQLERVGTELEIIKLSSKTKRIVCHISQDEFLMCKKIENALSELATKHLETKFVSIEATKSPFFTDKLAIRILPTIICIVDGNVENIIVGFDKIGGIELDIDKLESLLVEYRAIRSSNYDN